MQNIPYTYLIGWSTLKIYYYGVRYSKKCHPSDLWNPYKTSSKVVKTYWKKYGNPDILQIRKTFSSSMKAQEWEHKVLRRMKILERSDFLNCSVGGSYNTEKHLQAISKRMSLCNPMKNPEISNRVANQLRTSNKIRMQNMSEVERKLKYGHSRKPKRIKTKTLKVYEYTLTNHTTGMIYTTQSLKSFTQLYNLSRDVLLKYLKRPDDIISLPKRGPRQLNEKRKNTNGWSIRSKLLYDTSS